MNEETTKSRSPNAPKIPLQKALQHVEALYKKVGRSAVSREASAQALDFSGLTGSSLTLLGALNHYGLIDNISGTVKISALALRILHPLNAADKAAAIKQAALTPSVYAEIFQNHNGLAEDVLANQLIHNNFAPDVAKRVASAYKANDLFANLSGAESLPIVPAEATPSTVTVPPKPEPAFAHKHRVYGGVTSIPANDSLAVFNVPLGLCEVEIRFTGDLLMPDDFDALAEYIGIFKKQYVRKLEAKKAANEAAAKAAPTTGAPAAEEDWS